jgi:hypothetical protein
LLSGTLFKLATGSNNLRLLNLCTLLEENDVAKKAKNKSTKNQRVTISNGSATNGDFWEKGKTLINQLIRGNVKFSMFA